MSISAPHTEQLRGVIVTTVSIVLLHLISTVSWRRGYQGDQNSD